MHSNPRQAFTAALLFALCLLGLLLTIPHLDSFDLSLLNQIHTRATPTLTAIARTASFIGSPRMVWPLTILLAATLYLRRPRRPAYLLALVVGASGTLESILKVLVRRPRPPVPWAYVTESTYSFPSGHATLALALYGTIVWITFRSPHPHWQRALAAVLAAVTIPTIGLSRLYLGAHRPTDVLAGYLTAAITLAIAIAADLVL